MRDDYCTINSRISKIAISLFFLLWLSVTSLIYYGNFHIIVKTSYTVINSVWIIYLFYQYQFNNHIVKYDLLFRLQNIVIWDKNNQTQLLTIKKWYSIGNICAIIEANNTTMSQKFIIFQDNCSDKTFKQIMRHIKWSRLQTT